MLRRAVGASGARLMRLSHSSVTRPPLSSSSVARPLLRGNMVRPSVRQLATSTKAHEHYSKAFKSIDNSASAPPPPTRPSPPASSSATASVSAPTFASSAAAASSAASPVASSASQPPRLGTSVPYARRLSPDTPSPFRAAPPDEQPSVFDDPNSPQSRAWSRLAYVFYTVLQGMLVLGYVLVGTRIVLTIWPPDEWAEPATPAAADTAVAATSTGAPVVLVPAVADGTTQTPAAR